MESALAAELLSYSNLSVTLKEPSWVKRRERAGLHTYKPTLTLKIKFPLAHLKEVSIELISKGPEGLPTIIWCIVLKRGTLNHLVTFQQGEKSLHTETSCKLASKMMWRILLMMKDTFGIQQSTTTCFHVLDLLDSVKESFMNSGTAPSINGNCQCFHASLLREVEKCFGSTTIRGVLEKAFYVDISGMYTDSNFLMVFHQLETLLHHSDQSVRELYLM